MQSGATGRPPGNGVHVTAKSSLIIRRTPVLGNAHNGPAPSFTSAYMRPGSPGATSSVATCHVPWVAGADSVGSAGVVAGESVVSAAGDPTGRADVETGVDSLPPAQAAANSTIKIGHARCRMNMNRCLSTVFFRQGGRHTSLFRKRMIGRAVQNSERPGAISIHAQRQQLVTCQKRSPGHTAAHCHRVILSCPAPYSCGTGRTSPPCPGPAVGCTYIGSRQCPRKYTLPPGSDLRLCSRASP